MKILITVVKILSYILEAINKIIQNIFEITLNISNIIIPKPFIIFYNIILYIYTFYSFLFMLLNNLILGVSIGTNSSQLINLNLDTNTKVFSIWGYIYWNLTSKVLFQSTILQIFRRDNLINKNNNNNKFLRNFINSNFLNSKWLQYWSRQNTKKSYTTLDKLETVLKDSQKNIDLKNNILTIISIYKSWVSNAKSLNYTSITDKNKEKKLIDSLLNRIKLNNSNNKIIKECEIIVISWLVFNTTVKSSDVSIEELLTTLKSKIISMFNDDYIDKIEQDAVSNNFENFYKNCKDNINKI